MQTDTLSAADLARQTPASRDRYVDFLRLFSIAVVVLGHWLMAVVIWQGREFHTGNVIGMVPGLWLATWLAPGDADLLLRRRLRQPRDDRRAAAQGRGRDRVRRRPRRPAC